MSGTGTQARTSALEEVQRETRTRPARKWFVLTIVAPFVAVFLISKFIGLQHASVPVIGDFLSLASGVAFLFGAWRSIETRTALAALDITIKPAQKEAGGSREDARDLLAQSRGMLASDLQRTLFDHIRWEWRAYLVGTALLLTALLLSIAKEVF